MKWTNFIVNRFFVEKISVDSSVSLREDQTYDTGKRWMIGIVRYGTVARGSSRHHRVVVVCGGALLKQREQDGWHRTS